MLGRAFIRLHRVVVGPISCQILKLKTTSHPAKHTILSISRSSVACPTNVFTPRLYSQKPNTEEMQVVDYDYVKKVAKNMNIMIIDVREPDEIKEHGKIPNSVNIPLGTVAISLSASEKEFKQTFNRDKPGENTEIIFYCMIGKRSGMAQKHALNLGYKNAKNYLGSWTDWATKSQ